MTPKHKLAVTVFERDNYTCQYCGKMFSEEQPPLHLHRRVFGSQGGKYDMENLASCCWECHQIHDKLKNIKTKFELDNTVINELIQRYNGR